MAADRDKHHDSSVVQLPETWALDPGLTDRDLSTNLHTMAGGSTVDTISFSDDSGRLPVGHCRALFVAIRPGCAW